MTVKSRVPDDLNDDRSMRPFLDSLDRKLIKISQLELPASPTTTQIETYLNSMKAILQER